MVRGFETAAGELGAGGVGAVSIRRAGPPESLECGDMPLREAGDGEVRIRVHRAGVNFADVLARQGIYPDAPKPRFVPGYEASGVVDSAGGRGRGRRPWGGAARGKPGRMRAVHSAVRAAAGPAPVVEAIWRAAPQEAAISFFR